jgi:hypothetical protein
VILFIEKTWFLWWMLSNVIAVRWFHILSVRAKLESPEAQDSATEEKSDYSVWQLLRHAQPISLSEAKDAL